MTRADATAAAAARAADRGEPMPVPRVVPGVGPTRNALFLAVVLIHVVRRLCPPY